MEEKELIAEAASIIGRSRRLVAFSGAGVSEESGIPTFRDPGGLWDRFDPMELGGGDIFTSIFSGAGIPQAAVDFITEMMTVLERAQPNPGHYALGELEQLGILKSVVTQNIDNLHREGGNTRVIEVHGNLFRLACMACGNKVLLGREELFAMGRELAELMAKGDLEGVIKLASRCPACGGACRPDVVGFGEPVQDMGLAMAEARDCDALLILGTSGMVYPAAYIPEHAKKTGAKLVEINATGCYFPDLVDVGIVGKTGEILPPIVERVKDIKSFNIF
ncbi:MAG: NAD-dependent deacylase [Actinobacteria bacterium]|nr:NAD-dependent deacylase [Actinomycetota bacterium]